MYVKHLITQDIATLQQGQLLILLHSEHVNIIDMYDNAYIIDNSGLFVF